MTAVADDGARARARADGEQVPLAHALGDRYGFARAWRCVALARGSREARALIRLRVRQDFEAIRDVAERAHARARATTMVAGGAAAVALLGVCWLWAVTWSPLVAWVPLVVVQVVTAPMRWRLPAVFRRQCLRGQKVVKPVTRVATVHTADYRDHAAVAGDGVGTAAQRQVVERSKRWLTPKLYGVTRTGVGWEGRVRMPDTMTVDYLAEWAPTVAAGHWAALTVKADPDDRAHGTFAIVRRDPLRGPGVDPPMLEEGSSVETSAWDPCEVAIDEAGQVVMWDLPYERGLIGGQPDSGKSMLGTNVAVHFACDPAAPLFIIDPTGVDFAVLEQCVAASGFGDYTRANTPDEVIRVLRAAERELESRERWMQDYYATTGVAKRKIERGDPFAPALVLQDEWERVRDMMGKRRDEYDRIIGKLLSNSRKCAMSVWNLTQDPRYDATPVKHRNKHSIRAAHFVIGDTPSDIILGDGTAEAGRSAAREIAADQPGVALTLTREGFTRVRSYLWRDEPLAALARSAAMRRAQRKHAAPAGTEPCEVVGGGSGVPGESSGGVKGGQGGVAGAGGAEGSGGGRRAGGRAEGVE